MRQKYLNVAGATNMYIRSSRVLACYCSKSLSTNVYIPSVKLSLIQYTYHALFIVTDTVYILHIVHYQIFDEAPRLVSMPYVFMYFQLTMFMNCNLHLAHVLWVLVIIRMSCQAFLFHLKLDSLVDISE